MKTEQKVKERVRFSRKVFEERKIAEAHYADDNGIQLEDDRFRAVPEYYTEDGLTNLQNMEQQIKLNVGRI